MARVSRKEPKLGPHGGTDPSQSYGLSDLPWDCIRGHPLTGRFGLDPEGLGTAGRLRVSPAGGKMASRR